MPRCCFSYLLLSHSENVARSYVFESTYVARCNKQLVHNKHTCAYCLARCFNQAIVITQISYPLDQDTKDVQSPLSSLQPIDLYNHSIHTQSLWMMNLRLFR